MSSGHRLLPDRTREGSMEWRRECPGVEVISRDRASAYAEAAGLAAPDAVHIADRWHLLHNIGEALQRVLDSKHALLSKAADNVVLRLPTLM
jgi:transposase